MGLPVELRLTSGTALQAFSVPRLGGQIYAMPGMASRFNLRADAEGQFAGLNTQYNGAQFARQHFVAEAVAPADFDAWTATAQAAPPLDGERSPVWPNPACWMRPWPSGASRAIRSTRP
ncbi:putative quinol oxidase subunit 2 precursor [Roseovarius sp. THAF8]|uniref:hypothetical protein n=1 Tax=Roseovarius sp. THAF8 TaxID=2587846 RepID=UPI0012AAAE65|nr:hypothetical protein [Roseovarius sp. THAF8]QFT96004.1 putative quinol oxidase subunit 2 precursor [Roseovarius sp. THAF8]